MKRPIPETQPPSTAGPSILDLLEPEFATRGGGRSEVRFPVKPEFTIPGGSVQGGIVAAMLDAAMAFAGDTPITTASMHFEVLRPVRGKWLAVVGTITRSGRRIVFAEAEMRDEAGEVVARGRQTGVRAG